MIISYWRSIPWDFKRMLTLIAEEEEPNQSSPVIFARPPVVRRALERRQPVYKRPSSIDRKLKVVRKLVIQPLRKPSLLLHGNVCPAKRAITISQHPLHENPNSQKWTYALGTSTCSKSPLSPSPSPSHLFRNPPSLCSSRATFPSSPSST